MEKVRPYQLLAALIRGAFEHCSIETCEELIAEQVDAVLVEEREAVKALCLAEEKKSAEESRANPDNANLTGRVFVARSIYNEVCARGLTRVKRKV